MATNNCTPGYEYELNGQAVALCNTVDCWSDRTLYGTVDEVPIESDLSSLKDDYPAFRRILCNSCWTLALETNQGIVLLNPVTSFWQTEDGDRSLYYDLETSPNLWLEFLFTSDRNEFLHSYSLNLSEASDESLAAQIDEDAILGAIASINEWISSYTRDEMPFLINASGVLKGATTQEIGIPEYVSFAEYQMQMAIACLETYQQTGIGAYRERGINLAIALVSFFYPGMAIAIIDNWLPHELVYPGGAPKTAYEVETASQAIHANAVGGSLLTVDTAEQAVNANEIQVESYDWFYNVLIL